MLEAGGESATSKRLRPFRPRHVRPCQRRLHASLMARLDRLGAAKEVAQISAAIGREFSHTLSCWRSWKSRRQNSKQRSNALLRQACCSGKAYRHTRLIYSNTR